MKIPEVMDCWIHASWVPDSIFGKSMGVVWCSASCCLLETELGLEDLDCNCWWGSHSDLLISWVGLRIQLSASRSVLVWCLLDFGLNISVSTTFINLQNSRQVLESSWLLTDHVLRSANFDQVFKFSDFLTDEQCSPICKILDRCQILNLWKFLIDDWSCFVICTSIRCSSFRTSVTFWLLSDVHQFAKCSTGVGIWISESSWLMSDHVLWSTWSWSSFNQVFRCKDFGDFRTAKRRSSICKILDKCWKFESLKVPDWWKIILCDLQVSIRCWHLRTTVLRFKGDLRVLFFVTSEFFSRWLQFFLLVHPELVRINELILSLCLDWMTHVPSKLLLVLDASLAIRQHVGDVWMPQ